MSRLELENYDFVDDRTANELRLYDSGNASDVFVLPDGGDLQLQNRSFDLNGNALTDSTQDYLDLTGDGNDVRISTGQAIEDGSGTTRVELIGASTVIYNDAGKSALQLTDGGFHQIDARTNEPFRIRDVEQGSPGVQYDTGASAGVLRTPNAGARIESDGIKTSGKGLEVKYDPTNDIGKFLSFDRDTSTHHDIQFAGSLYDFSGNPANLRIATGQSIEDGSGNNRFKLLSSGSFIQDDAGDGRIWVKSNDEFRFTATSSSPLTVYDADGTQIGVQYDTDASVGTLRTPNSDIILENYSGTQSNGLQLGYNGTDGIIQSRDGGSDSNLTINASLVNFSNGNANLRLATGQAIEDGVGNERFSIDSASTKIRDETQVDVIKVDSSSEVRIKARSGSPFRINDNQQGAIGVQYTTDTSTGTLELTNAVGEFAADTGLSIGGSSRGTALNVTAGTSSLSAWIRMANGNSNNVGIRNNSGEVEGIDSAGNTSTLT